MTRIARAAVAAATVAMLALLTGMPGTLAMPTLRRRALPRPTSARTCIGWVAGAAAGSVGSAGRWDPAKGLAAAGSTGPGSARRAGCRVRGDHRRWERPLRSRSTRRSAGVR